MEKINTSGLSAEAIELVRTETIKEGIYAGLSSGLASAVISQRFFRFNRNTTLFCGVLSGVLSGILFTQAFRETAVAQLHAEELRKRVESQNNPNNSSDTVSI